MNKTTLKFMKIFTASALTLHSSMINYAVALPTKAQITSGNGQVENSGSTLTIQQNTQYISIDYSSFNIAGNETVNFLQPDASSVAINRVSGANPSQIHGQLNANGQVFLINSNGVIFGQNASIDVAGLLVSTLALSNEKVLTGQYDFTASNQVGTQIINQGQINVKDAGYIAFISNHISNEGDLNAPNGSIQLHSADRVMVTLNQQAVSIESTQATVDGLIENHGVISAGNGYIVFNSNTLESLQETVVNNTGIIRASSMLEENGEVVILAAGGDVFNEGVIDVNAQDENSSGGFITIQADRIALQGKMLADGQGVGNGGQIYANATDELFATKTSMSSVNGGINGHGGEVIYFSDNNALFEADASITARGGELAGNGGFVEVSGLTWVGVKGFVDTRSPTGLNGTFLIDPTTIDIIAGSSIVGGSFGAGAWTSGADTASIGVDDINTQLLTNNVIIDTASSDGGGSGAGGAYVSIGDINVNAAINLNGADGRTLTLQADNSINVNANICDGGVTCLMTPDDNVGLVFTAANELIIADGVEVNSGNAKISVVATAGVQATGLVSSNTADDAISIITNGAITNTGDTLTDITIVNGGGATLTALSGIDLDTNIDKLAVSNLLSGSVLINELSSLELVGFNVGSNFNLNIGTDLTLSSDIDLNGLDGNTFILTAANNLNINANICDGGATCVVTPDDNVALVLSATNALTILDGVSVNSGSS
ncbi:MAG TPA: hypothetical protein DIS98_15540, partial [Colwellia sp.]|nr:hypothetical protein [Colwellia sp.]